MKCIDVAVLYLTLEMKVRALYFWILHCITVFESCQMNAETLVLERSPNVSSLRLQQTGVSHIPIIKTGIFWITP